MSGTHVTFLGSGDAFFAGGRHQAGYLVQSEECTLLLDCGSSTLASLKRLGIAPSGIDTVCLSHLHGDHFAGLPFLFLEYVYADPRNRPLTIAGPPGTASRVGSLYRAMYRELSARPLPFRLDFVELLPGARREIGPIRVNPFRVPHQETETSLGLGVEIGSSRILYSGDTGWTEDLIAHAEGTDLFVCECCFFETRVTFHLDYPRIAENRSRFGTGRLILTHLGSEVLARQGEIETELARDGLTVSLRQNDSGPRLPRSV